MATGTPEVRGSASRAERRAAQRAGTAPTTSAGWRVLLVRWRVALWGAATFAVFALTIAAIERKITWYLAVDQLGYLLFAHDLLHGRVFHDWPVATALAHVLPVQTDVLSQTYVWDHGLLYSRYAPGYPLLMAAWIGLFGDGAAHLLNPLIFVVLLAVLIGLGWRVHRSLWRGTAAVVLIMICPTGVSLWALTPTRDMASHLFGFVGLLALAGRGSLSPRAALAAGLALGFAASIRPDAVLYLVPATILALARWRPHPYRRGRGALLAALGLLIGLAPSMAYYWAATGNPFVPTQSMEVTEFLGAPEAATPADDGGGKVGYPPVAWHGTTLTPVSGGGLKLENLPTTLPGNWEKIRTAYGDVLLGLAGAGLVVALFLRPAFGLAAGSYVLAALLFYSCWARPYGRYLVSIWLFVPLLIMEGTVGTLDLVRWVERRVGRGGGRALAIALAAALLVGYFAAAPSPDLTARLAVTGLLAFGSAFLLVAAAVWSEHRVATFGVPLLIVLLVALGCVRLSWTLPSRASFQRGDAAQAASIIRHTLLPRAVVITTEDIGRPMENLEYYADVRAVYLTDLDRWNIPVWSAVLDFLVSDMEPYLLIPRSLPGHDFMLSTLRPHVLVELVKEIPSENGLDYFVSSASGPLELWHIR